MQDYLQRGRQHERLAADVLKLRLLDGFRSWAANPRRRGEFAAVHDLISEYEIRGFEFPGTEIAAYFEVVMRTARELFATRDDEKKRELGEAIMEVLGGGAHETAMTARCTSEVYACVI